MGSMKILVFFCFIGIYAGFCSASAHKELMRIAKEWHDEYYAGMTPIRIDLQVKGIRDPTLIKTEQGEKKLCTIAETELENITNKTMTKYTNGVDLKKNVTQSAMIPDSIEFSGEVPFPTGIEGVTGRFGFKFGQSEAEQTLASEENTIKVPSDAIVLEPYTKCSVVNEVYIQNITSTYSVRLELDTRTFDMLEFRKQLPVFFTQLSVPLMYMNIAEVKYTDGYSRILYDNGISSAKSTVSYLGDFLKSYIEEVIKPSSYPVFIRDKVTNETVLEITAPLPKGKVYVHTYMEVSIEKLTFESKQGPISSTLEEENEDKSSSLE